MVKKKANLSTREKATMNLIANNKDSVKAVTALDELIAHASQLQDLLYFHSLKKSAVAQTDLKKATSAYHEALLMVEDTLQEALKADSQRKELVTRMTKELEELKKV